MKRLALFIACVLCATGAFVSTPAFASETSDLLSWVQQTAAAVANVGEENLFKRHYYWDAVENLDFESANEDGSLSEWQQDWYISHDWSDYGIAIANLEPGDAVTVNGSTVLILGRDAWPAGSINWDIFDAIGWDKTVFQTCLGDEAIWIAYGIPVNPTEEFLANHA